MSSPDTNLDKQKRRHAGPLIGMAVVTVLAIAIIVYWVGEEVATAPENGAETVQEGLTADELNDGKVDAPANATVEEVAPAPKN
tara:strand:+ start:154811 stop:155062 length:252 start_codon:yes stop_codon:yes gene_type:complete